MKLQPLLDYIHKYITLTKEEEQFILSKINNRKFQKSDFIVQNGDLCHFENFVLSGCVKTYFIDQDGQEIIVMLAIENWWTSDLGSFISREPAKLNVQCVEKTELAQIHYNDLQELYQKVPNLERFFRLIIQQAFVASQNRIVRNYSEPAKERYLQFREEYAAIEQRVPQYMVASYLGITKEFLSKIRKQLLFEK
jgi:CRP-like cAMP-binding protein